MENISTQTALWVAIASGIFALLGALGTQIINAIISLRAKRLELVYSRKADSYREFMQRAAAFWHDPNDAEKYLQFVHAFFATSIVASDDVMNAFTPGKEGLYTLSRTLHTTSQETNQHTREKELLGEIIEKANKAMRRDLNRFSKHR